MVERKYLRKIRNQYTPDPKITATRTITHGTKIIGPNSSLILSQDQTRCIIQETQDKERGGLL